MPEDPVMRTSRLHRNFAAIVPLVTIGLAACGSSSTPFDPAALSQSTDKIINAMDSSQVVQSLDVLGGKMTAGAPAMNSLSDFASPPGAALSGGFPAWAAQRLRGLESPGSALSVASPQAVIPQIALGKTFTYNADLDVYLASDLAGAPSNGVRFLLYAVNPLTQTVATPLTQIGHADVLDESSSNTNQLRLKAYVTGNDTPVIDYTATASVTLTNGTPTAGTASAKGSLSNGTTGVDLDLSESFAAATGLSVDYKLTVPETGVNVDFQASISLAGIAQVTILVRHGDSNDVIAASGTVGGSITGNITHNGTLVINVAGTTDSPTFTDASGNSVTAAEAVALTRVALFITKVLVHVSGLMAPAHVLLGFPFST
jgi:hypothetical protein